MALPRACPANRIENQRAPNSGGNMNASDLSNEVNASCPPPDARSYRRAVAVAAIGSLAIGLPLGASIANAKGGPDDGQDFGVQTLSAPANLVSGGNVLVQITFKHANKNHPLVITLNGQDVSTVFRAGSDQNTLVGLVTGLSVGKNALRVQGNGSSGIKDQTLEIVNYPITGPIISGPHEVPFICQTQDFALPDGTKLGASTDVDCSAPTKITYLYLPTGATAFKPLPSTTSLPSDVSKTTTITGATVNFIVRVETSTVDRGIYQSAILHDPTSDPAPAWYAPPKGWNKRLIAIEGFGCPGGWYVQGSAEGSLSFAGMDFNLLSPTRLGEGYALF